MTLTREQYVLYFAQRCRYLHKKTLKSTTRIGVEQIATSRIRMHRYPSWMPLRMHLCLEKILDTIWISPEEKLYFSSLAIPYHIIHGLVCDYAMKDIIKFIRSLGDKRFYAKTYLESDSG